MSGIIFKNIIHVAGEEEKIELNIYRRHEPSRYFVCINFNNYSKRLWDKYCSHFITNETKAQWDQLTLQWPTEAVT